MQENAPIFLIFGQLMRDYIITPQKKSLENQMGGNILYAGEGTRVWQKNDKNIGLVSRVGKNYNPEWVTLLEEEGYLTDGITFLDQNQDLRYFRQYSDLRTYTTSEPVKHFSQAKLIFPKSLLGFKGIKNPYDDLLNRSELSIRVRDIPTNFFSAKFAHLCPMDLETHSLLPASLREKGVESITVDPGNGYMRADRYHDISPLVSGLTTFIPSEEELFSLFQSRTTDIWEMTEEIANWGCDFVVVTLGDEGQYLFDNLSKNRYRIPAYPSKMVDLTGVGDLFAGGYIAGLEATGDPLRAVVYGSATASVSVEGSGVFYTRDVLKSLLDARIHYLQEGIRKI